MNSRSIQAVLRSLAKSGSSQTDAELLRRFVSERDERAFTALVHRHGRLVWAVCRHLTRCDADADDAFQATFLVLIRSAAKVRDASKLSSWLHGVAYKVCAKSRQSAKRRIEREQAGATKHCNGFVVADSAWDQALAAVHEEIARLPEKLRAPFVMCCLEGKSVTQAAVELSCKLSALSARLTRAKHALQQRLDSRGVTVGVAAATVAITAGSAGTAPAAVLAKASRWLLAGNRIPDSIFELSQGVLSMSFGKTKLIAVGIVVACGLGLGGIQWLTNAQAQERTAPARPRPVVEPQPLSPPRGEYDSDTVDQAKRAPTEKPAGPASRWDYDFVPATEMVPGKFVKLLQDREAQGWEFNGEVTLRYKGTGPHWVFRRPRGPASTFTELWTEIGRRGEKDLRSWSESVNLPSGLHSSGASRAEIEAEFKRLQEKLKQLDDAESRPTQVIRVDMSKTNPDTLSKLVEVVQKQADQKFGASQLRMTVDGSSGSIFLQGAPQEVKWATDAINMLCGNAAQTARPQSSGATEKR